MANTRQHLENILNFPVEAIAAQTNPAANTTSASLPGGVPILPVEDVTDLLHTEAILTPPRPDIIALLAPLASDPDAPIIQAATRLADHDRTRP